MKIYVDEILWVEHRVALVAKLDLIRNLIEQYLQVKREACILAFIPVAGMPDQLLLNVEMQILPGPDRTRSLVEALGRNIQQHLASVAQQQPAFRCMQHDPATYVVLR